MNLNATIFNHMLISLTICFYMKTYKFIYNIGPYAYIIYYRIKLCWAIWLNRLTYLQTYLTICIYRAIWNHGQLFTSICGHMLPNAPYMQRYITIYMQLYSTIWDRMQVYASKCSYNQLYRTKSNNM